MERITDKLKKLLALAERGCGGEAENARRLLEEHLRKYGLTLEDLYENKTSRRIFKYRNKEERQIIVQVEKPRNFDPFGQSGFALLATI